MSEIAEGTRVVRIERRGFSSTYFTPTAAATWNTRSHIATSWRTVGASSTEPSWKWKLG